MMASAARARLPFAHSVIWSISRLTLRPMIASIRATDSFTVSTSTWLLEGAGWFCRVFPVSLQWHRSFCSVRVPSTSTRISECAYPGGHPRIVRQVRVGFRGWNSSSTDCFGSLIRERSLRSFFCASSFCRKRKRGDRVACPDRPCLVMPKPFWPPCVI
jgi:hypothetical protein